MKKTILEIYALAVCFAAIGCFVITLGIALYDVIKIANPEFTISDWRYEKYRNNDLFWRNRHSNEKDLARPPEDVLTKRRIEGLRLSLEAERKEGLKSLTFTTIILIIAAVLFGIHWRMARRARETNLTT